MVAKPLFTPESLRDLIDLGEGQFLELKGTWSYDRDPPEALGKNAVRTTVAEYVAAFANADGGTLVIGVEDDGTATGHGRSADEIEQLVAVPGRRLRSPLSCDYQLLDLDVDEPTRIVRRPASLQLDFGGFLKGRTVDRAAARAPAIALVDAGGDMVVRGAGPDGSGWLVDIEDPADARCTLATLRVSDRAIATSAANRRRWRAGSRTLHHLIDPRTGAPSTSDLAQVTVLAATAERADVYAKAAFLLGAAGGRALVAARPDLAAVFVHDDGTLEPIGDVELVDAPDGRWARA